MKRLAATAVLLMLAAPALAAEPASGPASGEDVKIARTTAQQRALTEILSARIRSALDGEAYAISCKGKDCGVSSVGE